MTELFHDEGAMPAPIPPAVSNPAFRNWIRGKLFGLSAFDQIAAHLDQNRGISSNFMIRRMRKGLSA